MSFFNQMYECALNNDDQALALLLNQGACIDEKQNNENFSTVAAKLVSDGHTDEALKLINQFGAGPEYVLQALIENSQIEAAEKLKKQFQININLEHFKILTPERRRKTFNQLAKINLDPLKQLNAKVWVGDSTQVEQLLAVNLNLVKPSSYLETLTAKNKILESTLLRAAQGGHMTLLAKYYEAKELPDLLGNHLVGLNDMDDKGYCSHRFLNESLALHTLSFIQDEKLIKNLVKAIKKDGLMYAEHVYDINEVKDKSSIIKQLMGTYGLAYDKAYYCLEKLYTRTAIKTAQLMQFYNISENLAGKWLHSPAIRIWFREIQPALKRKGIFQTDDIINYIDKYVLEASLKETVAFKTKIVPNQINTLKAAASTFFRPTILEDDPPHKKPKLSLKFR
ncbi:Uncharacterised protein [Legionella busanensis]|uniref:Uncharacterized protein n=1 Tax=Legionella busanensis TaxID=190655 RepID=A0A378JIU7_9GAMM|nr:hypothetical protein [Legionella busanensis]STX51074.1 Uncharacterised protein [Legionella busanensis]